MEQATGSLARWRSNIYLIPQLIQNDVSSTKVRLFIRRELSVKYLLPAPVEEYISEHGLYREEGSMTPEGSGSGSAVTEKEKETSKN
jgi:nicotinamide mononucleotide adenylyltransferase